MQTFCKTFKFYSLLCPFILDKLIIHTTCLIVIPVITHVTLKIFYVNADTQDNDLSASHRFTAGPRSKHLPNTGRSAHDPWAVAQHEDQLLNVSWSKGPVFTCGKRNQLHPLCDLGFEKEDSYISNTLMATYD